MEYDDTMAQNEGVFDGDPRYLLYHKVLCRICDKYHSIQQKGMTPEEKTFVMLSAGRMQEEKDL